MSQITECRLASILDFNICREMVENAKDNYVILCPHYSINIASKYEDGEELQYDLDDLSEFIGCFVSVSDYDDLVVDMTESD